MGHDGIERIRGNAEIAKIGIEKRPDQFARHLEDRPSIHAEAIHLRRRGRVVRVMERPAADARRQVSARGERRESPGMNHARLGRRARHENRRRRPVAEEHGTFGFVEIAHVRRHFAADNKNAVKRPVGNELGGRVERNQKRQTGRVDIETKRPAIG